MTENRAEELDAVMHSVSADAPAPGAVWAVAWGPREERRVVTGSAGGLEQDAILRLSSVTKLIATVAVLALADTGMLALDDPLRRWVPAWADRRVLRERHGQLADTVPAERDVTVRDLLLMGFGLGYDMTAGEDDELAAASAREEILSSWVCPGVDQRTWVERAAALPMAHQPGAGWLYQTSYDALTVVLEAASGLPVAGLPREVVLDPLGLAETTYSLRADQLSRVPALFFPDEQGGMQLAAPEADRSLLSAPSFPSLSTGLVSTVTDMVVFGQLLLDLGLGPCGRVVSPESVRAMATPALGGAAGELAGEFLDAGLSWGLGAAVDGQGRFGWDGGTGTSLWVDPTAGTAAVLLTRHGMGGVAPPVYLTRFWEAVRSAPWP
ncbi:serine hydrolase domain-containing protein [Ornithinimicrobium pratense]|uniref:Beta-lactamase family protein n=1 Tax=Ornithinimicrobium pratense TaxID=2593973 RepID=A0A5J6V5Z0_9MICO|nr:serine hydrolase domain-containing protein [Ornithinimicrobium pratense]QFG68442.1 beta-lactamase family protein [Ornithinimicrobium pratense]